MRTASIAILCVGALFGSNPANAFPFWGKARQIHSSVEVGQLVYRGTDRLIANMRPRPGNAGILTPVDQVIVSTIVSVDDLDQSSTFGRVASQLVLSRLSQLGYQVRDVTYMRGLEISEAGERMLSRDARRLSKDYNAGAVVAGTYAVSGQTIILNLRLLNAADGALISSSDVVLPLNLDTWPLVNAKAPKVTRSPEAIIFGDAYPVGAPYREKQPRN